MYTILALVIYIAIFIFCISNNILILFLKVFGCCFWLIEGKMNRYKSKKETPGFSSLTWRLVLFRYPKTNQKKQWTQRSSSCYLQQGSDRGGFFWDRYFHLNALWQNGSNSIFAFLFMCTSTSQLNCTTGVRRVPYIVWLQLYLEFMVRVFFF